MANTPETVVENAQIVLRTIGSDNLSAYFSERLKGERNLASRPGMLSAYARLNGLSALSLLFRVANDETEFPATRIAATKSLTLLAEQQPLRINRAAVVTALVNLLEDDGQELRSAAAISLCTLRVREAEKSLRKFTDTDRLNLIAQEETRKFLAAIEASPFRRIIPVTDRFFGRERELYEVSEAFKKSKIAVLLGLNGMGKTVLAAQYAQQSPYDVKLWLSGLRDATPSELALEVIRQAEFLLNERRSALPLSESRKAVGWETETKQLLAELSDYTVLMVIDDYQVISEKGSLADFVRTFTSELEKFDCLIVSRFQPKQLEATGIPVGALNREDARAFIESELAALGVLPSFDPDSVTRILELAQGNPLLIKLIVKDSPHGEINDLTASQYEYVLEFVLKRSITGLDTPQQRTLEVLAQFDGSVDLRSPVLLTIFMDELIVSWPTALRELEQAGLIVNDSDRLSFVHILLRDYVRQQVDSRTRRRINQTITTYSQRLANPESDTVK